MRIFTKTNKDWVISKENKADSQIGFVCVKLFKYKLFRKLCIKFIKIIEGGELFSQSLRSILKVYYGVTIGKYTYGSCMIPGKLPNGTVVGSYCSFASGLKIFRRNHPFDYLSQHPFFYNSKLGLVNEDKIITNEDNPLIIGSDVWVGDSVTILPACKKIGNGAVIGAGSVVTKDINEFEIVAGNPAKRIRSRYSNEIRDKINLLHWWEKSLLELLDAESLLISKVDMTSLTNYLRRK